MRKRYTPKLTLFADTDWCSTVGIERIARFFACHAGIRKRYTIPPGAKIWIGTSFSPVSGAFKRENRINLYPVMRETINPNNPYPGYNPRPFYWWVEVES